jgi:hypothetical protein
MSTTIEATATFIDKVDVPEIFADQMRSVAIGDNVVRIELCSTRFEMLQASRPPSAKVSPAVRLALTVPAAVALHAALSDQLAGLEKQGLLKRGPVTASSDAKH